MNKYSFIIEFDEMSESQINKLWEYLSERNIKFHVLKEEDLKKENQELKNQQKEFIQWLENQIQKQETYGGYFSRFFQDILSKYKEIIGGDNK